MSPAERLQAAIAEGELLHPGYEAEIEAGVGTAWAKVRFQRGGWPASYQAPARLREPDGAVYFAEVIN